MISAVIRDANDRAGNPNEISVVKMWNGRDELAPTGTRDGTGLATDLSLPTASGTIGTSLS